jgi:hypothetical protein
MKTTIMMNEKEAAVDYANNYFEMHETNNYKALKQGFEAGTNWQQERMYSDMQEYAEFCVECDRAGLKLIVAKDWFEQFKKEKGL